MENYDHWEDRLIEESISMKIFLPYHTHNKSNKMALELNEKIPCDSELPYTGHSLYDTIDTMFGQLE